MILITGLHMFQINLVLRFSIQNIVMISSYINIICISQNQNILRPLEIIVPKIFFFQVKDTDIDNERKPSLFMVAVVILVHRGVCATTTFQRSGSGTEGQFWQTLAHKQKIRNLHFLCQNAFSSLTFFKFYSKEQEHSA